MPLTFITKYMQKTVGLNLFNMMNPLLGILFALYLTKEPVQSSNDFQIQEFLAHLNDFQIAIYLPEEWEVYYSSALIPLLQLSLQSLTKASQPAQLLRNNERRNGAIHLGRHVQNKVAWIIMVSAYSDS